MIKPWCLNKRNMTYCRMDYFLYVVWAPLQTVWVSFLPVMSRAGRDHSVSQQWIMGMNDRSGEILQILPPPACHTLHSGPDTSLLYVYQSLMKCWQVSPHNGYCVPLIVFNEPWALTMAGPYCRWQLRGPTAAPRWEKILCIMNICNPPLAPDHLTCLADRSESETVCCNMVSGVWLERKPCCCEFYEFSYVMLRWIMREENICLFFYYLFYLYEIWICLNWLQFAPFSFWFIFSAEQESALKDRCASL